MTENLTLMGGSTNEQTTSQTDQNSQSHVEAILCTESWAGLLVDHMGSRL